MMQFRKKFRQYRHTLQETILYTFSFDFVLYCGFLLKGLVAVESNGPLERISSLFIERLWGVGCTDNLLCNDNSVFF